MYEPVTWGTMSRDPFLGTGFDHPPGNDSSRTVLSWHYYCWLLEIESINNINPLINDSLPNFARFFCNEWYGLSSFSKQFSKQTKRVFSIILRQLNTYFEVIEADTKKLGNSASFLTEFGWCNFPKSDGSPNTEACEALLTACDTHFQSWTYWDTENMVDPKLRDLAMLLTRVFPVATMGTPLNMVYNATSKYFFYVFQINITTSEQAIQSTDVFVPTYLYPNGFDVTVSSNLEWHFDPLTSRVGLYLKNEIIRDIVASSLTLSKAEPLYQSQASVSILCK